MAIIDCIIWKPQGNKVVYAYHYPENNLSTYTQLIVQESQVALLFSKGRLIGKFGPDKHTLDTSNLPILRSLYGIPFGGKNPFTAEVWFVNLVESYNIPWDIFQLGIHDSDYNTFLPLMASGQYGLKVIDPEKFLIKVVGTKYIYTEDEMTAQFTGEFSTKVKSALVQYMTQNHIGYKFVSGYLDQLSAHVTEVMRPFWANLGLELTKFYISNIDIDTTTPEGVKVKQALAEQSSMSITGHTWQQAQMFDTANNAIGQFGNGGDSSLIGGLMAINMMGGMNGGGMGGAAMAPQYQQPTFGPGGQGGYPGGQGGYPGGQGGYPGGQGSFPGGQQPRMVFCADCAQKFPSTSGFCPHCGHKYNPCPKCGTDNPEGARRCVSCGTQLAGPSQKCAFCGAEIPQGTRFCPSCGQPVIAPDNKCSRCGATLPPGTKFCPSCGQKRNN